MPASLALRSVRYLIKVSAITGLDMRKLRHDPTELRTRAIQRLLWLPVFGQVFERTYAIPTGGVDYLAFLVPSILAQSVLFVAIFNGTSVIWERDLGIVHKCLASPTPRTAIVLGKALAAGVRERFRGIGQVLTMPPFFASSAIYPTDIMPLWLKAVAHANPPGDVFDGPRSLMRAGGASTFDLGADFAVLATGLAVPTWIGVWMYPRLIT
jgi:ABC-2 type transport system permease protein